MSAVPQVLIRSVAERLAYAAHDTASTGEYDDDARAFIESLIGAGWTPPASPLASPEATRP